MGAFIIQGGQHESTVPSRSAPRRINNHGQVHVEPRNIDKVGKFANGKLHGVGVRQAVDSGAKVLGHWQNDKLSSGSIQWPDTIHADGTGSTDGYAGFLDERLQPHGQGTYTQEYTGQWTNGHLRGHVHALPTTSTRLENGDLQWTWKKGENEETATYRGQQLNNLPHGSGKLTMSHTGTWQHGALPGFLRRELPFRPDEKWQ